MSESADSAIRRLHAEGSTDPAAWAGAIMGAFEPGAVGEQAAAWQARLGEVHVALNYLPGGALSYPEIVVVRAVVVMLMERYSDNDDGGGMMVELAGIALQTGVKADLISFATGVVEATGMAQQTPMLQRCLLARDLTGLDSSVASVMSIHRVLEDHWSLALYMESVTDRLRVIRTKIYDGLRPVSKVKDEASSEA